MKYIFEMDPNSLTARMNIGLPPGMVGRIGGSCLEAGVIHLHGCGDLTYLETYWGCENKVWSDLIEYLHICSLLDENDIPPDMHHQIIDRMEGMHMYRRGFANIQSVQKRRVKTE